MLLLPALLVLPVLGSHAPQQEPSADDSALLAFVERVEETMLFADASFFRESIDFDAMMATVSEGVDVPDGFVQSFSSGVRSSFDFAQQVQDELDAADGTYSFLRMLPGDRALFRLAGDNGLNYHELFLARAEDESVRVVDIYIYLSGERITQTMRRPFLAAATASNRDLLSRLLQPESEYIEALPAIQEMITKAADDPIGALKTCESLPESVQKQLEILLMRVQISSVLDEKTYLAALTAFRQEYPESPALDLLLIDFHLIRGEHRLALERIDSVDERVGGDPYLDILRAGVLWLAGKPEDAKAAAQRAAERDAYMQYEAWWVLLDIALTEEDHATTLRLMQALEVEYGVEWMDLTEVDTYAAFVASPEYRTWLERTPPGEELGSDG